MKTILYIAGDAKSHQELGQKLRDLPEGEYVIQIKQNRAIRSLSQNSYYHVILNLIAIHTGQGSGDQIFDHDQLHELFKKKFNSEVKYLPKGGMELVPQSTSKLDTKEFTIFINRVKQFAMDEWGINIPENKDVDYQKWMDVENQYTKTFSGF